MIKLREAGRRRLGLEDGRWFFFMFSERNSMRNDKFGLRVRGLISPVPRRASIVTQRLIKAQQ